MRLTGFFPIIAALVAGCSTATVVQDNEELRALAQLDGKIRIRMIAANISAGNLQSYDTGEGIRIFQGTKADVAMIQEFNYGGNSASDIRQMVDQAFGSEFYVFRGEPAHIPNGIVSRYPIIEGGEWDDTVVPDRALTWARIDIPGDRDLWAISVHLSTSNASNRNQEAKTLLAGMSGRIPDRDYVVLGGDFNTKARSEPCLQTLSAVFVTDGPYPTDRQGVQGTNASRGKPYDWVLADRDLNPYEVPVVLGQSTFTSGLVVDTRVYSPLSDIAPAKQNDSGATNMQHMAIVRDFALPAKGGDTPPPPPPPPPAPTGATGPTASTDAPPPDTTGDIQVQLNEVLANEPGSNIDAEFIELYNAGSGDADISGWSLSDQSSTRHVFPSGTWLRRGEFVVVYGNLSSTHSLGLSNSGDTVILRNASRDVIDSVTYTKDQAAEDGTSLTRLPSGAWAVSTDPKATPGQ